MNHFARAQVLPANHPVLRNTLVLGVDPGKTLADLKRARTNSSGAAQLWPQDEQSIKLILERFDPLQIEWELSSIGGRSDEQVSSAPRLVSSAPRFVSSAPRELRPGRSDEQVRPD